MSKSMLRLLMKEPLSSEVSIESMWSKNFINALTSAALATFPIVGALISPLGAAPVRFNEEIRPLFIENCTSCHGGVKQAGEVSFIYRQQALGKGKSGKTIIVPGDPEGSELIKRLTTTDPDDRMPPPKEHPKPLSPKEIDLFRRWIKEGAQWEEHWAFIPPQDEVPQTLSQPDWPHRSLDAFVLARLDRERLSPSPPATPNEWLRRATFDLTGLPPTLDELSTFRAAVSKVGDQAYELAVDRLLASPHYGERWASMWMDLARYSDTKGYEKDRHRNMWPYRDWLIDAFNADMPFNEFTIAQLAGDLKPNPEWQDLVATMFHRNTQTNEEGGSDDEEYRLHAMIDRVNTTWTVWQASTFGCAQCHDHPYDPIRQTDYYRFATYFNNTEDADLSSGFPAIQLPPDSEKAKKSFLLEQKITSIRHTLNQAAHPQLMKDQMWSSMSATHVTTSHGGLTKKASGILQTTGTQSVNTRFDLTFPATSFTALRLTIFPDSPDPKKAPFRGSVLSHLSLTLELPDGKKVNLPIKEVFADALTGPYDPMDTIQKNASGFGAYPKLFTTRYAVIVPATPISAPDGSQLHLKLLNKASTTGNQATTLRRFRWESSNDPHWTTLVNAPKRSTLWNSLHSLQKQKNQLGGTSIPIMRDRPTAAARETRLFARGSFISKEQVVTPGVPLIFHSLSEKNHDNRLGMAKWLTSPDNPLTARAIVNRLWHECFGIGIVETLGDFGSSGQSPSHPKLLDHLALRLQKDHQWSLKKSLRDIVLSSTYRQCHQVSPALLTKDPRNRLLARGPRTRLTAEMIRDQALMTSGLLSQKIHGPSVMPLQPDGIWQTVYSSARWKTSPGEDRYRRALYTYWKRTSPYPSLISFDASSREICTARRIATNTPLQALVTLNDPAYLECAQALALRMVTEGGDTLQKQLTFAITLTQSRKANPTAVNTLVSLYDNALKTYQSDPKLTQQIAKSPELAALTLCANTILNTDPALTK